MLQPIVLSGGFGSRLWPLSREQQPKQLLKLFGEFSMLQSTILRLADFSGDLPISRKPIVVCNQSYRFVTAEQLQEIKVSGTVMLEPFARNTAPALTVQSGSYQGEDDIVRLEDVYGRVETAALA